jgi:DNA-directed RNA polymerase
MLDGGDFRHRHDAYGSHANDGDMLHRHARQEFVNMHSLNLLDFLYQQWKQQNKAIPEPPQRGSFDLSQVLGKTYTFH